MKIILFTIAVVVLLWLLRRSFRQVGGRRPEAPLPPPQPMLACAQCGLHLPVGEALPGRGGVFCGDAHRADFERAHPE